jgi:hypothetical protein
MAITVKEAVIVAMIVESILYGTPFRADSRVERSDDTSSIRTIHILVWCYSMGIDISAHVCGNCTPGAGCCLPAIRLGYHGAHRALVSQIPAWLNQPNPQHIVVDANHFWQGFVTSGDPDAFFQDVTKTTFKNVLYLVEILVSDAIIVR